MALRPQSEYLNGDSAMISVSWTCLTTSANSGTISLVSETPSPQIHISKGALSVAVHIQRSVEPSNF